MVQPYPTTPNEPQQPTTLPGQPTLPGEEPGVQPIHRPIPEQPIHRPIPEQPIHTPLHPEPGNPEQGDPQPS